ncbi:cytochrome (ubi)quinol oxidase subunit III [Sphingomonas phyllosphaerae]|uniref:cytochrome (ubi)quinol oxidase subunit III n=1 Tax=Sphingomonas phyllosphaerae TaxID=257003 RepID=UPI0024135253|nr:cytochrome (ubi)quinol oxidase subunit III [Sphingomonas phyllosphaerae]
MSGEIADPRHEGDGGAKSDPPGHGEGGPAPKQVTVAFGFWIFLLSDIIMFSGLFAAYAVLAPNTAGGPEGSELFELRLVFVETLCLLFSSFTCGVMSIMAVRQRAGATYLWAAFTALLGLSFLAIELYELTHLILDGAAPTHSAFLSALFTLVGAHGLHVAVGLVWLTVMMGQVATLGFTDAVERRLLCFGLYWHALDIIWVALFTVVYLYGVMG